MDTDNALVKVSDVVTAIDYAVDHLDALLEYARGWNDCCDYIRDKLEHLPKEANEEC